MYWPESLSKEIQKKVKEPYHVDDMKTPSGQVHVGSLRGVVIHDVIHKELIKEGKKSKYTYIYNDMDPFKKVPNYLEGFEEDLGKPLFKIKAPYNKGNYAQYFAENFTESFQKIGCTPEILFSSKLYQEGKFNDVIKEALDKVEQIRKIYSNVAGYDKPDNFYPIQVICPKCGRVGTTLVTGWDGKEVDYECKTDLVDWAQGCGDKGKISPFNGNAKFMWKVDWPAHWKVLGINIEGAGKDHSSAGGSRDMAKEICKVFEIEEPFDIPYEWFLTKSGSKMSTSKGVGMFAEDFANILPPEVGRFMILRTHYNSALLFDPNGDTIPDLYDEFDRCAKNYFMDKPEDTEAAKYYEASIIRSHFKDPVFLPRFRTLSTLIQMPAIDIVEWAEEEKGSDLSILEKEILKERVEYAQKWLTTYAPSKYVFLFQENVPEEVKDFDKHQKEFLQNLAEIIETQFSSGKIDADLLQTKIFELSKTLHVSTKNAFKAIYVSLLGKDSGPKAGWLIKDIGNQKTAERFRAVSNL